MTIVEAKPASVGAPPGIWARVAAGLNTLAAIIASLLAIDIANLAAELVYFGFEDFLTLGQPLPTFPSDSAHNAFHLLEHTGFALTGAVALLFLAWGPIKRGQASGIAALSVAGLPAAALPIVAYELFGPWHSYAFHPVALWLLAVAASAMGLGIRHWPWHAPRPLRITDDTSKAS
jgi:hypothetical protein